MTESLAVYQTSDRLAELFERAGAASARICALPSEQIQQLHAGAARQQARLSAALDGSPLTDETADRVDCGELDALTSQSWADTWAAAATPIHPAIAQANPRMDGVAGGWAAAMGIEARAVDQIAAREYANLRAVTQIETDVAHTFLAQPLDAIIRLHTVICGGLAAPMDIGRLRTTERAIHDGAQGKMLWAAPAPQRLGGLMDQLLDWLADAGELAPTLIVASVVHERLLEWQPFEAANGRLARSVARVIRRARGLDAHGLAVPEVYWRREALWYHREVLATIRRRGDLTQWLHKIAAAEMLALEDVVADGDHAEELPEELVHVLSVSGAFVTVREVATALGTDPEVARRLLLLARRAGMVEDDVTVAVQRFRVIA